MSEPNIIPKTSTEVATTTDIVAGKPSKLSKATIDGGNLSALRERVLNSAAEAVKIEMPKAPVLDSVQKAGAGLPQANPPQPLQTPELPQTTTPPEAPAPSTLETPTTAPVEKKVGIQPIRTLRDDIAHVVERNKISLVSAIATEQDRRHSESQNDTNRDVKQKTSLLTPSSYFLLGVSTVLFFVGLAVFALYYAFFQKTPIGVAPTSLPSYIFSEMQTQLPVTGMDRRALMDALSAEKDRARIRLGAMTLIYPILKNDTGWQLMQSREFFVALGTNIPTVLERTLTPIFSLGVHEFDGNEPFIIFGIGSYDAAFAGMLEWEENLSANLSPLFGRVSLTRVLDPVETAPLPPASTTLPSFLVIPSQTGVESTTTASTSVGQTSTTTNMATSTASSTPLPIVEELPVVKPRSIGFSTLRFQDVVIRNKDVRVLKNAEGVISLLYAFLDPQTIVITTNEYTFIEVLTRYTSKR